MTDTAVLVAFADRRRGGWAALRVGHCRLTRRPVKRPLTGPLPATASIRSCAGSARISAWAAREELTATAIRRIGGIEIRAVSDDALDHVDTVVRRVAYGAQARRSVGDRGLPHPDVHSGADADDGHAVAD